MRILAHFDIFGAPFYHTVDDNKIRHQSSIGGVYSFLCGILSLSYFIYLIVLWQKNQLLPKVTYQTKICNDNHIEVELEKALFFDFITNSSRSNSINPFINHIVIPQILIQENFTFIKNQTVNISDNYIPSSQFNFTINQQQNIILLFNLCNEQSKYQCNEENKIKFFDQAQQLLYFTVQMKTFDYSNRKLISFNKTFAYLYDQNQTLYNQIHFKLSKLIIDDGWIIVQDQETLFVSDIHLISQNFPQSVVDKQFGNKILLKFSFDIDPLIEEIHIVYPKLGEVLAMYGSICSLMMSFKVLILLFNQKQQKKKILSQIIKYQNPNVFNKWKKKQKLQSKMKKNQFKKLTKKEAEKKINILNQLNQLYYFEMSLKEINREIHKMKRRSSSFNQKVLQRKIDDDTFIQTDINYHNMKENGYDVNFVRRSSEISQFNNEVFEYF